MAPGERSQKGKKLKREAVVSIFIFYSSFIRFQRNRFVIFRRKKFNRVDCTIFCIDLKIESSVRFTIRSTLSHRKCDEKKLISSCYDILCVEEANKYV